MGKFLRVLVVVIFVLAIISLTLASLLFGKREILKGRTHTLEQGIIKLARTLEAEPPATPEDPPSYPPKDISDCTEESLDSPTLSDFWDNYRPELESLDQGVLDLEPLTRDLMSYYRIDPVTMKPARDPISGLKITDGEGTAQGVVDEVIARANAQYDQLTATRQQLTGIRTELVDTITELNGRKTDLRERIAAVFVLNNQIAKLNTTMTGMRGQLDEVQEQIGTLEGDIANLRQEKEVLEEENEGLNIKSEELSGIIQDLRGQLDRPSRTLGTGSTDISAGTFDTARIDIAPGTKGTVASVDQDHLFVVLQLDPEFIEELLNVLTDGRLPLIELLVKRPDGGKFVTKVRIKQLKSEDGLAIADILPDWQQTPIEIGDLIFLQ